MFSYYENKDFEIVLVRFEDMRENLLLYFIDDFFIILLIEEREEKEF